MIPEMHAHVKLLNHCTALLFSKIIEDKKKFRKETFYMSWKFAINTTKTQIVKQVIKHTNYNSFIFNPELLMQDLIKES